MSESASRSEVIWDDATTAPEKQELPSIEAQREGLRSAVFEAERKYRIVFVGRFFQGSTGIVASLHRALEGVGHTVFELEFARHRSAFDRSSGAAGGYGPVFFRPDAVDSVFRSFEPEIVVFCAGGVVLDEAGQQYFRQRGIMTIGLTLSDPDVQDSVIDYVGNFDFHTTNAELSLRRYHEQGHANTFLMPFGIDRDYVLREVPPAPELAADAICIGHAAGRPDRHEVMTRLAELVNVRVYGNGWPLPGAEPVAGDRLLQAAHEGLIHVNFPATRAGFTNVKCGVFETIGAGSILATARFDEMSHLFDYDDEILGYDSAEDLAQQISALKSDPVALERVRRKGFARLLSDHLYEHRWLQLFADIDAAIRDPDGCKDAAERERLEGILSQTHGRPRHVIISGFYGAQNRGDDLLLDAIASSLRRADHDANVIVAGVQPAEVERSSGYQSFRRSDQHVAERFASMATSVILGAGGLWHDYTIAKAGGVAGMVTGAALSPSHLVQLPLMVKAYGGSFHVYGMGVGPLQDEAAKAVVRLTGSLAESVIVRDEESLALLDSVSSRWSAKPVVAPDAVYSLPLTTAESGLELPERYLLLNVRPWGSVNESSLRLRAAVLRVADRIGIPVVALPMQNIDERMLAAPEGEPDPYAASVPASLSGPEFLGVIDGAAAVVSMRLHANLLAHRLGRPAVGFSYDEKVRSHFNQLGRHEMVLDLDADDDEIEGAIARALAESALPTAVQERVRELESASIAAIDGVARAIAAGPVQISPIAGMVHLPPESTASAKTADVEKAIWPAAQGIDLSRARVSSGNLHDKDAAVAHRRRRQAGGDLFALDVRAPRRGDFVEWELALPASDEGRRIELWIKQQYSERARLAGYMAYSVMVDDELLFTQDITAWQPRNTVWIAAGPSPRSRHIRVRLEALRNCPDWNWGKASAMLIERARQDAWAGSGELRWGASSPFARDEAEYALDELKGLAATTRAAIEQVQDRIPRTALRDETAGGESTVRAAATTGAASAKLGTAIALGSAIVESGNLDDPSATVAHARSLTDTGDTFGLTARAPRRNDHVDWRLRLASQEGVGQRLELLIQQKYGEVVAVAGHMAYSVLVDGETLFTQDVTAWRPRNTVWIALGSELVDPVVTVRLHALRDCPDWGWGEASPITIESGRTLKWQAGTGIRWGASSPMAEAV